MQKGNGSMIKINLLGKYKSKSSVTTELSKLENLKNIRVEDLFKPDKSIYYISVILWLAPVLSGLYYLKLSNDKSTLKESLEKIKLKKAQLEAQRKSLLERERQIQESIKSLQSKIQDIQKSKDILIGLKAYYSPFKNYLNLYTTRIPNNTWIYEYRQVVDFNNNRISTEIKFASLDANAIGSYGNLVKASSSKYYITNVERKVGQHGFAYYSASLNLESQLIQENKP